MTKILLLGSDGQLGTAIQQHQRADEFELIACNKHRVDLTKPDSIAHAIQQHQPSIILNTAAYTAVDKAETESAQAMQINVDGVRNLAIIANQAHIPLIHLSTDYVFSGSHHKPYTESDVCEPVNIYGLSKWQGEQTIREHHAQHYILRVSGVFSEFKHNFLKTILRLANERETLSIIDDQITRPTYAGHIADILFKLITHKIPFGTYHYADAPAVSWYTLACSIINEAKMTQTLRVQNIQAISSRDYPTAAKRPAFSVLDTSLLEQQLNIAPYTWQQGIIAAIKALHTQENIT